MTRLQATINWKPDPYQTKIIGLFELDLKALFAWCFHSIICCLFMAQNLDSAGTKKQDFLRMSKIASAWW